MENKARIGRQKIVNWVLNGVIIIMSVLFIIMVGVMIEELHYAFSPGYSENSFSYSIENERYFNMVGGYHHNVQAGFEGNADMKEYYGVAEYYEAASLYKAYSVAGNTEMANYFLEKMEQTEAKMGSGFITMEPIHKQLGIE